MSKPAEQPEGNARHFDSPEQEAFLNLWRTYDRLHVLEEELFGRYNLTPQQYNALRLLRGEAGRKLATLALASRLVSRAPDITRLLDKLEERGLIERERPADNRRVVLIALTPAGRDMLTELDNQVRECHTRQLGHLSDQQLRELVAMLRAARAPHEDPSSHWLPKTNGGPATDAETSRIVAMMREQPVLPDVRRFDAAGGVRIYRITCEAFPGFAVNIYLLLEAGPPTIIDAGSGFGNANEQLLEGLEKIRSQFGETVTLADLKRIIITHGHIDHFGGLAFLHERAPQAEIAIHELDARILTAFEERVAVAKRGIRQFLQESGVQAELLDEVLEVYGYSKKNVRSLPVERTLVDHQELDGLKFIHTPGHCPGQVCIAVGDVLLTADHILPEISPHQSPESIMPYTGLGHYLESLDKVERMEGFRLALGGHNGPMENVYKRIGEIRQGHVRKLDKITALIQQAPEPLTANEISKQLYTHVSGFHVLLALEEVAAHVEYLYQHGKLSIANLDEYQRGENAPIRYVVA